VAQRKGKDYKGERIRRMSSFNAALSEILKDEEVCKCNIMTGYYGFK